MAFEKVPAAGDEAKKPVENILEKIKL